MPQKAVISTILSLVLCWGKLLAQADTVLPAKNDVKASFSNLFVEAPLGKNINAKKLNPHAISFVQSYMQKNEKGLRQMKGWAKPYFDMIDGILTQYQIPRELKYLAVIESGLRVNALSWAGAVGPWALMPGTAKMYGLTVTRQLDERTDYVKSTHVAAKLLKDLYAKYNDWLLVIAAYNGGPGRVNSAIKRSGSTDFWKLQYYLPAESQNHVKKFIATHYIMEEGGGETTFTKQELAAGALQTNSQLSQVEMDSSATVQISGKYKAKIIASEIDMPLKDFEKYNPSFDEAMAHDGIYDLRLPKSKMELFNERKSKILQQSLQEILKGVR